MNVKLLRKVAKYILAEPRRLYMWTWVKRKGDLGITTVSGRPFPHCGTVACIAGWACLLSKKDGPKVDYLETGAHLLELNKWESYRLFDPSHWPHKFERGTRAEGTKAVAKVAAARIEHFIRTKGKE